MRLDPVTYLTGALHARYGPLDEDARHRIQLASVHHLLVQGTDEQVLDASGAHGGAEGVDVVDGRRAQRPRQR